MRVLRKIFGWLYGKYKDGNSEILAAGSLSGRQGFLLITIEDFFPFKIMVFFE
jgi:hypothetical protein